MAETNQNKPGARPPPLSRALSYRARSDGLVEILDLDFAAYCHMENVIIADMQEEARRNGQPARYRFIAKAPIDTIVDLSVKYVNDRCSKFADSIRRLKKSTRIVGMREG